MSSATCIHNIAPVGTRGDGVRHSRHLVSMLSTRVLAIAMGLLLPSAALAAEGGVHVYLQPFSSDAARLTFTVSSLSAVNTNGIEIPLTLNLRVVAQREASRQRLLASGHLPTGSYAGFVFVVKQAALRNDRGDAALAVPDAPVRLDFPFTVAEQQSPVVWLTLDYHKAVSGGFGFTPAFLAVTPPKPIADHAGFVSNSRSNTITVFDKRLGQAVAVIGTCAGPAGMALDQYRRRLYVACSKDDEIQWIDVATGDVVERTRVAPGDRPTELALTPDGSTLLSVNAGSNSVSFFDALSLNRRDRVSVGSGPSSIALDPAGRRAFIFNTLSSTVSVLDISGRTGTATMSTEASPLRGRFNRRGDRLYIIHERSPYMTVVDPQQLTIVTRARLRTGVNAIAIDTVRDLVCIGGANDTVVEFYDPNALMPVYSMKTKAGVSYMSVDTESNTLYMVDTDTRSVLVARLTDRKAASEIDVGERPYWVAVMGEK